MTIWWKVAAGAVLLALWTGTLFLVYSKGSTAGQAEIQTKWDADKIVQANAAKKVEDDYRAKEQASAQAAATAADTRQREQNDASAQARDLLLSNDSLRKQYAALLASRRSAPANPAQASTGPSDDELSGLFSESRSLVVEGRQRLAECTAEVAERDKWISAVSNSGQ